MALSLSFTCDDYSWFEPLIHGEVAPEGIDLDVTATTPAPERHRQAIDGVVDVAEFSLGTYLTGWPDWAFVAIPAFPRRFFPQARIVVRADAGIEDPVDLEGRRVLCKSYQNTCALWAKGVLAEHYEVDLDAVDWYAMGPEPAAVDTPATLLDVDRDGADEALASGELDAAIWTKSAEVYPLRPNTAPLFPDVVDTERAYHDATGLYPTMHTVVVQDDVVEEHPWVPAELLRTFRRAQEQFAERCRFEAKFPLVWWQAYREQEAERFGDVWGRSFEFEANAAELATMTEYAAQQGLTDAPHDPDALFVTVDPSS